jgi:hypothetical protein
MPHDQAFQQRAGVRRYSQRRYSQRRRSRRGRPFLAVITAAVVVATGVTVISGLAEAALPQSVAPLIITGDFRVGGVLVCSSPAGPSFEQTAVDVRWDTGSGYPSEPQRETLDTTGLAVGTRIRCNSKGGRDSQPITLVDSALSNGVPTLEFVPSGSLRRVDGAPGINSFLRRYSADRTSSSLLELGQQSRSRPKMPSTAASSPTSIAKLLHRDLLGSHLLFNGGTSVQRQFALLSSLARQP